MDEYITKSDAVFCACKVLDKFGGCKMGVFCPDSGCIEVREVFENAPAANVKPVVYGKWMEWGFNIRCSVCGDEPYFERSNMPKYCPNCGAYMRYGAL